jgi:hypothetical protein
MYWPPRNNRLKMNRKRLFLKFDESLRPADGTLFLCSVAGPVSITTKEPAGYCFHNAILRRQGLIGKIRISGEQSRYST